MLNIHQFILHHLKNINGNKNLQSSPKHFKVTQTAERIISEIFDNYEKKSGKSYGTFNQEHFESLLKKYAQEVSVDLLTVSKDMANILLDKMPISSLNVNLLFSRIQKIKNDDSGDKKINDYLLIALVNNKDGAMIKGYSFEDSIYLNTKDIRFAGLIDISLWKHILAEETKPEDEQDKDIIAKQYISFLNAAEYFKTFLGCEDAREPKKTTALLISIIPELAKNLYPDSGQDPALRKRQEHELRKKVHSYLQAQAKSNIPFDAKSFANIVSPDNPEIVIALLNDNRFSIPDNFHLNLHEVNRLNTLEFKAKDWSIELHLDAILDGSIVYDRQEGFVILKNPPDSLIHNIENINNNYDSDT